MTKCLSLSGNGHVMTEKRTKTRGPQGRRLWRGREARAVPSAPCAKPPPPRKGPSCSGGCKGGHVGLGSPLLPATFQGRPSSRHEAGPLRGQTGATSTRSRRLRSGNVRSVGPRLCQVAAAPGRKTRHATKCHALPVTVPKPAAWPHSLAQRLMALHPASK